MDSLHKSPGKSLPSIAPKIKPQTTIKGASRGGGFGKVQMGHSVATGKSVTTRTSDGTSSDVYRSIPIQGKTQYSELLALPKKKDGSFFLHKRGGEMKQVKQSVERFDKIPKVDKKQTKTMEQMAREGAAQAMAGSGEDSDSDQPFAKSVLLSDRDSIQAFTYYGRRFGDSQHQNMRDTSPSVSDAVSFMQANRKIDQKKLNLKLPTPQTNMKTSREHGSEVKPSMMRKGSQGFQQPSVKGMWMDTNRTHNVSNSMAGLSGRKSIPVGVGYIMEEKMNDDLMKAFKPMLSSERAILPQKQSDTQLVNSISDFTAQDQTETVSAVHGGAQRANLFQKAKDRLNEKQRYPQIPTAISETQQAGETRNDEILAVSAAKNIGQATAVMLKNSLFQPQNKNVTTKTFLAPKLPPKSTLSPAIASGKANRLISAQQNKMIMKQRLATPFKDEDQIYFAQLLQAPPMTTSVTLPQATKDVVSRHGARIKSGKRKTRKIFGNNENPEQNKKKDGENTTSSVASLVLLPEKSLINQNTLSVGSLNSTERADQYRGKRAPCFVSNNEDIEILDTNSVEKQKNRFHKNFLTTGQCRIHRKAGCDLCSFNASSLNSPRSSIESPKGGAFESLDRLSKKKGSLVKQITKITNQLERLKSPEKKSLTRQLSSSIAPTITKSPEDWKRDLRKSTKSSKKGSITGLRGQLSGYMKQGNRPIHLDTIPHPPSVKNNGDLTGRSRDEALSNNVSSSPGKLKFVANQDDYLSRKLPQKGSSKAFRISSSKTTEVGRPSLPKQFTMKNLAVHNPNKKQGKQETEKEWQGDPDDSVFWNRIEQEKNQSIIKGDDVRNKQNTLLRKQSDVFEQLKEEDQQNQKNLNATQTNMNKTLASMQQQLLRGMGANRQSNMTFCNNTVKCTSNYEEPIQTEIDLNSNARDDGQHTFAEKSLNKRMLQDPSKAVLTDYDIVDEVGQHFAASVRHQLEFRDPDKDDSVGEDKNIEDLKKQLGNKINESKTPRMASDSGKNFLFSGQTNQTKPKSRHQIGTISSAMHDSRMGASQVTGTFPGGSDKKIPNASRQTSRTKGKFNNTGSAKSPTTGKNKDCVPEEGEGESFDDEKQKSLVLKELELSRPGTKVGMRHIKQEFRRSYESIRTSLPVPIADIIEENPNEDASELRKIEVKDKTLARVKDYDEWLAEQKDKPKEIEKERESRLAQFSPKNILNIPDNGVLKLPQADEASDRFEKKRNSVPQSNRVDSKLDGPDRGSASLTKERDLAETIEVQLNSRPRTRGNPKALTLQCPPTAKEEPLLKEKNSKDSLHSKKEKSVESCKNSEKNDDLNKVDLARAPDSEKNLLEAQVQRPSAFSNTQHKFKNKASIPSERNQASNAQITVLGSSLKDDDLMISCSQVDPAEMRSTMRQTGKMNVNGKQATSDILKNLIIEEDSRKSFSPLTDKSRSRRSAKFSPHPTNSIKLPQNSVGVADNDNQSAKKSAKFKDNLPPKSPINANKRSLPPRPQKQGQMSKTPQHQHNSKFLSKQDKPQPAKDSQNDDKIFERNQAVLDFLAFEDSEHSQLGKIIDKPDDEVKPDQPAPKVKKQLIELSPQRQSTKAKTPINQLPQQTSSDETHTPSVNVSQQIKKIDYNQSNEGMSASYYRHRDQWLAVQAASTVNKNTLESLKNSLKKSPKKSPQKSPIRQQANNQPVVNGLPFIVDSNAKNKVKQNLKKIEPKPQAALPPLKVDKQNTAEQPQNSQRQNSKNSQRQASADKQHRMQSPIPKNRRSQNQLQPISQSKEPQTDKKQLVRRSTLSIKSSGGRTQSSKNQRPLRRHSSQERQDEFFENYKDDLANDVGRKRRESSPADRQASQNRLYNQETIASILKRQNDSEGDLSKKAKKPPMPLKKKSKVSIFPPPEPRQDPPDEPLPNSPRALYIPYEEGVPYTESAPTNMPLPMRLPEDPPLEPCVFIMPNIFCPVDPDTPQNFEFDPREEQFVFAPIEPLSVMEPFEPEAPALPDQIISVSPMEELMPDVIDECESIQRLAEPDHDDEGILEYPKQELTMGLPLSGPAPDKNEPPMAVKADEPECDLTHEDENIAVDPKLHFLRPARVEKTSEMSIQCSNVEEETKRALQDAEVSDDDVFSTHTAYPGVVNKVTVGVQTNKAHFRKIENTPAFEKQQQKRSESTDWALSPIFDEIFFSKDQKQSAASRKMLQKQDPSQSGGKYQNCGSQVEERQILDELETPKLSQIECEYNVDQLKRKLSGKDKIEEDRLFELHKIGLSTLRSLMCNLRLEKEWELQTSQQYMPPEESSEFADVGGTIKLLTRNKKMYESRTLINRLLKMIIERDQLAEHAQINLQQQNGEKDLPQNAASQTKIPHEILSHIRRLSTRITSLINTLQEENRIFRRPFIVNGEEYHQKIERQDAQLQEMFSMQGQNQTN